MSRRGSKVGRSADSDLDCTAECNCQCHASVILTCVALGNLRLFQHCSTLCGNPWRIADRFGRTPLHVAASRGCLDTAKWLLSRKKVAVDTRDEESGWSALHRAAYFGELGSAITLVKVCDMYTCTIYILYMYMYIGLLSLAFSLLVSKSQVAHEWKRLSQ